MFSKAVLWIILLLFSCLPFAYFYAYLLTFLFFIAFCDTHFDNLLLLDTGTCAFNRFMRARHANWQFA